MERKICVAMLGPYPYETSCINGGVQAAFKNLVEGLLQTEELDLNILTFRPNHFSGQDQNQQGSLSIHLLTPYPRFERLRNYRTYRTMIARKLDQIQPDLIHVQDTAADAYVALRSGYPTLMTIHGIRNEDRKHFSSWKQKLRHYFDYAFIENYNLAHARYLIAVSQYAIQYYKHKLQADAEVFFIPNAVDEQFFTLRETSSKYMVLFTGRVIPLKRVMDLVQAFSLVLKQVPYAQLHIAGEVKSEQDYVNSIYHWIRDMKLEEHIHLLGHLNEASILHEFANCNILVLPSVQESAPMVISQAMAAGKPIVATRVGGISEMIGKDGKRGVLVDVGNIEQMATAIIRLLTNPDLQKEMGENGRSYARENYHIESVARQTVNIYRYILSKEQKVNV